MDKITLERIQLLHPDVRDEVLQMYKEICKALASNVICRFAYTLRSFAEQAELYKLGRTILFDAKGKRIGIVTNAKAGQSFHNYGLAFDIVLLIDKDKNGSYETASWDIKADYDLDGIIDWIEVTNICVKYGWNYLVNSKGQRWDWPHFQKDFGFTWQQLFDRHSKGLFIKGTNYVSLK